VKFLNNPAGLGKKEGEGGGTSSTDRGKEKGATTSLWVKRSRKKKGEKKGEGEKEHTSNEK